MFCGPSQSADLVEFSNVGEDDAAMIRLAKLGVGSLREIQEWDTPQLFDVLEVLAIDADIERYYTRHPEESPWHK